MEALDAWEERHDGAPRWCTINDYWGVPAGSVLCFHDFPGEHAADPQMRCQFVRCVRGLFDSVVSGRFRCVDAVRQSVACVVICGLRARVSRGLRWWQAVLLEKRRRQFARASRAGELRARSVMAERQICRCSAPMRGALLAHPPDPFLLTHCCLRACARRLHVATCSAFARTLCALLLFLALAMLFSVCLGVLTKVRVVFKYVPCRGAPVFFIVLRCAGHGQDQPCQLDGCAGLLGDMPGPPVVRRKRPLGRPGGRAPCLPRLPRRSSGGPRGLHFLYVFAPRALLGLRDRWRSSSCSAPSGSPGASGSRLATA